MTMFKTEVIILTETKGWKGGKVLIMRSNEIF